MKSQINTQIRLMATAIFFVLLTGLSSLYLMDSVQREEDKASQTQQKLLVAALTLEEAHTHFKMQIQEWKNLLLRGKNSSDYQTYFTNFNAQTDQVQQRLTSVSSAFEGESLNQLKSLTDSHKKLVETYLNTLSSIKVDTPAHVNDIDNSVRGLDRPLDKIFPELTTKHSLAVQNEMRSNNQDHAKSYQKHVWWISICVASSMFFIIFSFWIGIRATTDKSRV